MMNQILFAALLFSLPTASLGAQSTTTDSSSMPPPPAPLALVQPPLRERVAPQVGRDSVVRARADSSSTPSPSSGELFGRIALGSGGVVLGALGGGLLGYATIPHSDCTCDDPGLREFVIGASVGIAVGAALAAAIPKQRGGQCSYAKRALYGLLGAATVGSLGWLAPVDQRVIFIPLGSAVGGGVASAFCR